MARQFHAHHDQVLIEPLKISMTPGGIALPDSDESSSEIQVKTGTVRYVGPGPLADDGTRVPCQSVAGQEVEYYVLPSRARKRVIEGVELDIVRDNDVVGHYDAV